MQLKAIFLALFVLLQVGVGGSLCNCIVIDKCQELAGIEHAIAHALVVVSDDSECCERCYEATPLVSDSVGIVCNAEVDTPVVERSVVYKLPSSDNYAGEIGLPRAPPCGPGAPGTKTYLYKQVFLI